MNEYKRVIAIGDIHGQFEKLTDLWKKINFNDKEDFVVFLGDYIDRGERSVDCLKFIKMVTHFKQNVVALRGNHEDFMLHYFESHSVSSPIDYSEIWLDSNNGGDKTMRELKRLPPHEVAELLALVNTFPYYYNNLPSWFFVHAGINPKYGLYEQPLSDYLWVRNEFLSKYDGNLEMVVGHTPVQYLGSSYDTPVHLQNKITMMDTGAAMGKKISALDLVSGTYWQSL